MLLPRRLMMIRMNIKFKVQKATVIKGGSLFSLFIIWITFKKNPIHSLGNSRMLLSSWLIKIGINIKLKVCKKTIVMVRKATTVKGRKTWTVKGRKTWTVKGRKTWAVKVIGLCSLTKSSIKIKQNLIQGIMRIRSLRNSRMLLNRRKSMQNFCS
jgi:hypothetical protein